MKNPSGKSLLLLGAVVSMASCVDNNYDLSDIESTARVNVNDLTIPINIDSITLESVIDLDDTESVKVIDGQYVIERSGTVNAAEINIPGVKVTAPKIEPTTTIINAETRQNAASRAGEMPDLDFTMRFPLESEPTVCKFETTTGDEVSDYIVSLESCEFKSPVELDLTITLKEAAQLIKGITFTDVKFQIPKRLVIPDKTGDGINYEYDEESGILSVKDYYATGNSLTLQIYATGVDLSGRYDKTSHTITIDEEIYLKSGFAVLQDEDLNVNISEMPQSLTMQMSYALNNMEISTFSGIIQYTVEDIDVPDILLGDLPDVLNQPGTDISIANPCLYMQLSNPLWKYELKAETGLSLTALRQGEEDKTVGPIDIELVSDKEISSYCLSPEMPANVDAAYANAVHTPFADLGSVLSGNGMPQSIKVNLLDPKVPEQRVNRFPLGENMGEIEGKYKIVAPLELMGGSQIIYSDATDGWNDEDLDKLVITKMRITMNVSSDVPVKLELTGTAIDANGNDIIDEETGKAVEISGATVDAYADNQQVTLEAIGTIRHLDGIRYKAVATAAESTKVLTEDMTIKLTNVRPVVSGYYEDEF